MKFEIGMTIQYDECPPNIEALRNLCVWTDATIARYQKAQAAGEFKCLANIEEIVEADEEEGEPTHYKLKPTTNLESYPKEIWAVESELSHIS